MRHTLRGSKALVGGIAALALAASGCCPTSSGPAAGRTVSAGRPGCVAIDAIGQPSLLADSGIILVSPTASEATASRPNLPCGEVGGELVYNLGQGTVSNSSAVLLCGSHQPRAMRRSCAQALRPAASCQPAIAVPAALTPAAAPAAVCQPAAVEPAALCQPGVQIVDGSITLPAESLSLNEPAVMPAVVETLKTEPDVSTAPVMPAAPVASVESPIVESGVVESASVAPAAPTTPAASVAAKEPVVAAPAAVQTIAPVAAPTGVTIVDKYANISKKEALAPPLDFANPITMPSPLDIPAPPPELVRQAAGQNAAENFPPIPDVADMDAAVDALLSRENTPRDAANSSSLPAVELPPNLN